MNKPIAVLGDLNYYVLKESPESKALSNFLSETNLKQIITTPARITDTCESLLDVILVLSPDLVHARGVINTPINDRLPVYLELKLKLLKPPPCYIQTRSCKHYNPDLWMKVILALGSSENEAWKKKIQACTGFWTHDPCDTGAVLDQLS